MEKIQWHRIVFAVLLIIPLFTNAQEQDDPEQKEKTVEGFKFVPLPVVGYNIDIGFQYGLIVNLFNYGDGSLYPDYRYTFYTEFSRTTKGGGVNQLFFDSKYLLPGNIRITADLSYLTELSLNFYGFNGYDAVYRPGFAEKLDPEYRSRMFYNHERKFFRYTTDFQGRLKFDHLKWLAGIGYFDFEIGSVNIEKLNKGKKEEDKLPEVDLLYDKYRQWDIIHQNEANGGIIPSIKLGIIYDSRDNEPNPMNGIWTELILFYVPEILGNRHYGYTKLAVTHRQYFTLIKKRLNLAYRLGYQGTLGGNVPFYMQPYMITSFAKVTTTDGLGGAKSLRGVLRNRVVGDGMAFGNLELRWKFYRTILFNQNIYLAINAFTDAGRVVQKIKLPANLHNYLGKDDNFNDFFDPGSEGLHQTAGAGFQIAINQNTIISFEYGRALNKRDGDGSIYFGIGYLF